MAGVLALAVVTFKRFAEIHGYDLVIDDDFVDGATLDDPLGRQAKWRKIALLESLLPDYDLVVWFDADVMIKRFDRDIAKDVPKDCFQAFVLEHYAHRFNPNTGVWAMRNDEMAYRFLADVREVDSLDHNWADQAAVCLTLGWQIDKKYRRNDPSKYRTLAKPVHPSEFLARTGWLPPEWNPVGYASKWPSRAEHFTSASNEKRIAKMQRLLDELRLDEPMDRSV